MPTKNKTKSGRWTAEDELSLSLIYKDKTAKEAAKILGRSLNSVQAKIAQLGIQKKYTLDTTSFAPDTHVNCEHEQPRKNWFQRFFGL